MVPALIKRFVEAADCDANSGALKGMAPVTVWGTGTPRREIMHVDDFAAAALHLVDRSATGLINVGTGIDFRISSIAEMIADASGYRGEIQFDASKPDGMPCKVMDVQRLQCDYGWCDNGAADERIAQTVAWYRENRK